ncbi:MAG: hypothetical protein P8I11_05460 [Bacteroidia bacterium]|nr:hypothetical protein [Bacteroidia bacterium]
MKKIFLFLLTSLLSFSSFAQNLPQGIAYQAVAVKEGPYSVAGENPQAIYWSNKEIKVRFTILDQYPNPTNIYQEFHPVTTDDYGVFNLIIGQGSVLLGNFETIPWELGTAHLRVEIDFDNDDSYTITSFERFWSVPYAFVSKKVKGTNIDSAIQALNDKIIYLKDRDKDTVIGNEGITFKTIDSLNQVLQNKIDALRANDLDTVVGNEIQTLAIKGDSLSISDGNTVKIDFPDNLDNDPVNEIQTISLSNDTIRLSKRGGKIALKDINDYVKSNTGSTSSTNTSSSYSQNSLCFEGTLIDLTSWGSKNGVTYAFPAGRVYDSAFVFSANPLGTFVIDLKRDTIYKISNVSSTLDYVGDSIVYCCSSGGCDVIKINNDLSFITNYFSGGPGLRKSGNGLPYGGAESALVNASGDLIWLPYLWVGGRADFKKYSYANKTLTSVRNPYRNSDASFIVSGDTVVLGNCLINSTSMNIIRSFAFMKDRSMNSTFLFNNYIYYFSTDLRFRKYNLTTNSDLDIGTVYSGQFIGVNNDELFMKIGQYTGTTSSSYNFINLSLLAETSNVVSLNKNGILNHRGYNTNGLSPISTNNYGKIKGTYYTQNNRLYSNCYNGTYPSEGLGLFFSEK